MFENFPLVLTALALIAAGSADAQGDTFHYSAQDEFKRQALEKMEICIADKTQHFMFLGKRSEIRANVSLLCTGEVVRTGYMTQAQATALSDRLTNAAIAAILAGR